MSEDEDFRVESRRGQRIDKKVRHLGTIVGNLTKRIQSTPGKDNVSCLLY